MIIDDNLVEAAQSLLEDRFGQGLGAATAIYTLEGNCYSSVSLTCVSAASSVQPETGAICDAFKNAERISALVTVERRIEGGPMLYATPSGTTIDRLALAASREAEIAVHNLADKASFFVRPMKSLGATHVSEIAMDGNFDDGFRPLTKQLRALARVQAVPMAKDQWRACFRSALESSLVKRYSASQGKPRHPFDFHHPNELASARLRHIWNAFEAASHAFFSAIWEEHEATLRTLDLNDSDLLHARQGSEAMRFVFSNLLVWVGFHKPIPSELPFAPYATARLTEGEPMHISFRPAGVPEEDLDPVQELAGLLTTRGPGGLPHYLRERKLFSHPVFDNGTGRCPFDAVAIEIYRQTGLEILSAECDGLLLEDEPAVP